MKQVVLLVLAAGTVLALAACAKSPAHVEPATPVAEGDRVSFPADAPGLTALAVAPAAAHSGEVRRVTGRLAWDEEVTVRVYSPVAGRVLSVSAGLGETVARDAELCRLNSPDIAQAQADARRAAADLLLAGRTLDRLRDLFAHGAVARKDVEAAEDAEAGARAENQRAAARLQLYGVPAEGAVDGGFPLRAPLAGVVVEKNINPGQEVRPDQMLANAPQLFAPQFVLTDPSRLWVMLDVSETEAAALQVGEELRLISRAWPARTFAGRVESIGRSLDPATRTIRVRGSVDNSSRLLLAEMYVTVEILVNDVAGVDVPTNALFAREDRRFVFVETAPGKFQRRVVKVARESADRSVVSEGLSVGDRIVVEGCLLLESLLEGANS